MTFETPIIISNLVDNEIRFGVNLHIGNEKEGMIVNKVDEECCLQPGETMTVPLFWLIQSMSLYVKTWDLNYQMVIKNLHSSFKPKYKY